MRRGSGGRRAGKPKTRSRQADVETFWAKFNSRYPGTVSSVLPTKSSTKKKTLSESTRRSDDKRAPTSYEDAALACKRAVEKIAKECRRVNQRFCDKDFDIEHDLKSWTRDCLDGLETDSDDTSSSAQPKSVKRVSDIFSKPQFYVDGVSASDVKQGASSDCWFLAAVCALSSKKDLVDRICVSRDEIVGVYGFVFHRDGEWFHTVIDDRLYLIASDWWEATPSQKSIFERTNTSKEAERKYRDTLQKGSRALYFAQCPEENETWLPLLEKAYAKAHGDYTAINWGFSGEAVEDLTGGVTTELATTDILDKDRFWTDELQHVNEEFLFSCATGFYDQWQDSEQGGSYVTRDGIVSAHAYSIMDAVERKGQRLLRIRNPCLCEKCHWKGAWSDGSEQWTTQWMQELNHQFGDIGTFWISYEDMLEKFSRVERTRLFDESWTDTQQWTTVKVPFTAEYNETEFVITLSKAGPVVLVLSQLDERYFKGMQGEYKFQLHFDLYKDGDDDFIVHSHGKYSMKRSVNIDLPLLEPGTYSVLMKITASRSWNDTTDEDNESKKTPEKVLRQAFKSRPNKLLQVAKSYDLAHAKGMTSDTQEATKASIELGKTEEPILRPKERHDGLLSNIDSEKVASSTGNDVEQQTGAGAARDKAIDSATGEGDEPLPPTGGEIASNIITDTEETPNPAQEEPADAEPAPNHAKDVSPAKQETTADDDGSEDAELASDPWNAVCVVGLRVYSKDDRCSIEVVKPSLGADGVPKIGGVK